MLHAESPYIYITIYQLATSQPEHSSQQIIKTSKFT